MVKYLFLILPQEQTQKPDVKGVKKKEIILKLASNSG
jgi:hypothetical protein